MITLNKLTRELREEMLERGDINRFTSPRAMSIRVSRSWRRFDATPWTAPPKTLTRDFVSSVHRHDPCQTYEREFGERYEHAADIIIDAALAMMATGCANVEQAVKDRIAWRMRHGE